MKLSKKFIAMIFVIAMIFTLTACDGISLDLGNGYGIQIGGDGTKKSASVSQGTNNSTNNNNSATNGGNNQTSTTSKTNGGNKPTSNASKTNGNKPSSTPPKTNSSNKPSSTTSKTDGGNTGNSQTTEQPSGTVDSTLKPLSYNGLSEAITVTWTDKSIASAKVYYKAASSSSYTQVDKELVRSSGSNVGRVDIVGLKKGNYDVRVDVGSENSDIEIKNIGVAAYDRSGYAHFNNSNGVGAYNNDGTLKSGVKVVYVTEATKNSAGGGIVAAMKKSNTCIRVIGKITHDTLTSASKWEGKYTKLNGVMAPKDSGKEGTTWGVAEVGNVSNVTIEGIGEDAEFYQWGITFKRCNSIEVRNLTFTDYPEDACGVEGQKNDPSSSKYFWIHNNVFNQGKRLFDDSTEKDKKEGDGAIDIKYASYLTYSYNKVQNCHKTGLVGGSDENLQGNITFHHNYFYKNSSRMPLGRQANMHYYNNYFQSCTKVYDLRANAYVFSEANTFEGCKTPCTLDGGACKSFGDSGIKGATVVTDRTKTVSNGCTFGKTFDTDSSKFYYDGSKKVSKVSYLTNASQAKKDCTSSVGPWKKNLGV